MTMDRARMGEIEGKKMRAMPGGVFYNLPKLPKKGFIGHHGVASGLVAATIEDPSFVTGYLPSQRRPVKASPQPFGVGLNAQSPKQQTALPPGAIKRRTRLAARRSERDSWRLDRIHQLAVRDPGGIVLPGLSLSRALAEEAEEGEEQELSVVITPRTRWKLLNEGFREGDEKRDGTVSNQKFVSLLRLLDLDLGEGATLELLRKYNRGGRSDYLAFLQNIKRLLFPRGASPDAERSRDEGEGEEAEVEEDRASPVENAAWSEDDDIVMRGLRFKVAQVWGQWRSTADKEEELLFSGGGGAVRAASHSLESQLVLQRVTQRFQRCVSQVTSPTWLAAKSKPRHQLSSANVVVCI